MATIRITDLKLKTIIGTNDWERKKKQVVIINIMLEYNTARASKTDKLKYAVDYKTITKKIIEEVEASRYFLLEKLTAKVLDIAMANSLVKSATVRIDKPLALRFSKSVSVELNKKRYHE